MTTVVSRAQHQTNAGEDVSVSAVQSKCADPDKRASETAGRAPRGQLHRVVGRQAYPRSKSRW